MKIITIDEGFYVYQLDPADGEVEGLNFLALVEGGKALFLDTGYAANMKDALEDLARRKAIPVGAIASHFHPDHVGGLPLVPGIEIWGGEAWKSTAERCLEPGTTIPVAPTTIVSAQTAVEFGRRSLKIFPLPGHTDDSLAVLIDDTWLFVADSILLTNEGEPLLPSVHSRPVKKHIAAIEWLLEHAEYIFVPGHGAVMYDRERRLADLENRRRYLKAIAGAAGGVSFEEATRGCVPVFYGKAWHEENYR